MKTKTFLPLFRGFYGSHWDDVDFYGEEEHFNLPDGMYFYEFVDWDRYHNHIAKEMCSEVQHLLSDLVSDITFESIVSPKYYNFENDSINCEMTIDVDAINKYIHDNWSNFKDYIKLCYTSVDGFISSYTNDASEWIKGWEEDQHKVGSILQYICSEEGFEEPWDLNDCHVSLFYNDEIYEYQIAN